MINPGQVLLSTSSMSPWPDGFTQNGLYSLDIIISLTCDCSSDVNICLCSHDSNTCPFLWHQHLTVHLMLTSAPISITLRDYHQTVWWRYTSNWPVTVNVYLYFHDSNTQLFHLMLMSHDRSTCLFYLMSASASVPMTVTPDCCVWCQCPMAVTPNCSFDVNVPWQ